MSLQLTLDYTVVIETTTQGRQAETEGVKNILDETTNPNFGQNIILEEIKVEMSPHECPPSNYKSAIGTLRECVND